MEKCRSAPFESIRDEFELGQSQVPPKHHQLRGRLRSVSDRAHSDTQKATDSTEAGSCRQDRPHMVSTAAYLRSKEEQVTLLCVHGTLGRIIRRCILHRMLPHSLLTLCSMLMKWRRTSRENALTIRRCRNRSFGHLSEGGMLTTARLRSASRGHESRMPYPPHGRFVLEQF
jgi:hypothetical protein